ncbi:MAG: ABC transporter permease, partial [Candidatus Aminicenantes bacterium]|nr:ABC transporter permease [Candidatus Aminicenantes bacterium]
ILMLLFVLNEVTYDRFNTDSKNIYRIALKIDAEGRILNIPSVPPPMGPALVDNFPEIAQIGRLRTRGQALIAYEENLIEESRIIYADSGIFDIFSIDVVRGNPESFLEAPFNLVLTEEMAEKYFGDEDPINKTLKFNNEEVYTVAGVVKKMPENSHFKFNFLLSLSTLDRTGEALDSWLGFNFITYIKLQNGSSTEGLNEKYLALLMDNTPEQIKQMNLKIDLYLQPLTSIHLHSHTEGELEPGGNVAYIWILTTIALFVLLIACINFMNLSTAQSVHRAKEVGMRKVMGAQRGKLITQFLGETLLLSFISFILSLILIQALLPAFNQLSRKELVFNPFQNWLVTLGLIGITVLVGLIAGIYPAFFLSSYSPLDVFRSQYKAGRGHRFFRNGLVTFQFVISIALICCTFFVFFQMRFVKNYDLGFENEQVMVIHYRGQIGNQRDVFKSRILEIPGVIIASNSQTVPGIGSNETFFAFEGFNQGKPKVYSHTQADEDYLETLGMELSAGRFFSEEFPGDTKAVVMNESLAAEVGWDDPLGKIVRMTDVIDEKFVEVPYTVIGVVKDFHFESLRERVRGFVIMLSQGGGRLSVKVRPENISGTIRSIEKIWNEMSPGYPFEYSFLDDTFNRMYSDEQRIGKIFLAFTLITIFVACLGLFGLASFTAEQRTKEIGIRKVLGASVPNVVLLLSRQFTKWVLLANLIAWPLVFFTMHKWLQ